MFFLSPSFHFHVISSWLERSSRSISLPCTSGFVTGKLFRKARQEFVKHHTLSRKKKTLHLWLCQMSLCWCWVMWALSCVWTISANWGKGGSYLLPSISPRWLHELLNFWFFYLFSALCCPPVLGMWNCRIVVRGGVRVCVLPLWFVGPFSFSIFSLSQLSPPPVRSVDEGIHAMNLIPLNWSGDNDIAFTISN